MDTALARFSARAPRGALYRGSVEATHQPCAIKLIYGEMATDAQVVDRLEREMRAVRRIDHPHIVRLIDSGQSECRVPFLVMEWVEGRSLRKVVETEIPLEADRVGRLAQQLSAGLSAAHRLGYVHRDLKPANIMLTPTEHGWERAKILNFGIAAALQAPAERERLGKAGYILGSPTYMAPEQVDPTAVAPQTDVYALGVILYELLTGEPPFVGTLERVLVAKMTEPPPPLPPWTGGLGELVGRLLATRPEDRPPSALHVDAELGRLGLLGDDPSTTVRSRRKLHGAPAPSPTSTDGPADAANRPNGKTDRPTPTEPLGQPPAAPVPVADTLPLIATRAAPAPDELMSYEDAGPTRTEGPPKAIGTASSNSSVSIPPGAETLDAPPLSREVVEHRSADSAGRTPVPTGPPALGVPGAVRDPAEPHAPAGLVDVDDSVLYAVDSAPTRTVEPQDGPGPRFSLRPRGDEERMPRWMIALIFVALALVAATLTYAYLGVDATVVLADPPADHVVSP